MANNTKITPSEFQKTLDVIVKSYENNVRHIITSLNQKRSEKINSKDQSEITRVTQKLHKMQHAD